MQLLILSLIFLSIKSFAVEHPQLKAFPETIEGMKRFIIVLPHKERGEDSSFKVELIPAKRILSDDINLMRLAANIAAKPLKGWGYQYYVVTGKDVAMSTMMAVPEGTKQVEKLVQGTPVTIPYNSRLPIVIYAPKEYVIQYRIWKADIIQNSIQQ